MSVRFPFFLIISLAICSSFLSLLVSDAEAKIKGKQSVSSKKKKDSSRKERVTKRVLRPAGSPAGLGLQMEEEYLASEFVPETNEVLQKAVSLLGVKYRFGGNGYNGIDCSAFVKKAFSSLSEDLPRTAREQFVVGMEVPEEELQKGDLLFFQTYAKFPSHVGIYLGDDLMIHASSQGGRVMVSKMNTPYFKARYLGARRVPSVGGFLWELAAEADNKAAEQVEVSLLQ